MHIPPLLGALVLPTPLLLFPEMLPRAAAELCVLVLSGLLLWAMTWLLRGFGAIRWLALGLGLLAVIGWARAPHAGQQEILNTLSTADRVDLSLSATKHLGNLVFGLFVMALIARWARTRDRLVVIAGLVAFAGGAMLTVGFMGSPAFHLTTHARYFRVTFADLIPRIPLNLPGVAADGVNPNALAGSALLVAPLAIMVATVQSRSTVGMWGLRMGGAAAAAVSILILAVTQSNTAWFGAIILLVALSLISRRTRVTVALLAIALFISSQLFIDRSLMDPVTSLFINATKRSFAVRLALWESAADVLKGSPWFGIGLNQFHAVATPAPRFEAHAHNIFLQVALDIGLIGLIVYVALVGLLFARAARLAMFDRSSARHVAIGAAFSLAAVHLFGLTDAITLGARVGLVQWLASGLIVAAWETGEEPGAHGGSGASGSERSVDENG